MPVIRYTCTACGLVTRVEEGQNHIACACGAEYVSEPEAPPPDPAPEPA